MGRQGWDEHPRATGPSTRRREPPRACRQPSVELRLPSPRSMSRCRLALISCPLSPAQTGSVLCALPCLPGTARLISCPPSIPLCSSWVLARVPSQHGAQGLEHGHHGCGPALVPPEKCSSPWGGSWGAAGIGGYPAAPHTCPSPMWPVCSQSRRAAAGLLPVFVFCTCCSPGGCWKSLCE